MNKTFDRSFTRDVITAFSLRKNISITKALRQLYQGDYKTRVLVIEDIMRNLGTGSEGTRRWDSLGRIIRVLCSEIGVKPKMLRRPSSNRFEYREITIQPLVDSNSQDTKSNPTTNKHNPHREMLVRIDVALEALQYISLIQKDKVTTSRLLRATDDALIRGNFWVKLSANDCERVLSLDTQTLSDALAKEAQQHSC